jgi:hypothetical protein
MAAIHSRSLRAGDSCSGEPSRAARLYGELQPLLLRVAPPQASAVMRKARPRSGSAD